MVMPRRSANDESEEAVSYAVRAGKLMTIPLSGDGAVALPVALWTADGTSSLSWLKVKSGSSPVSFFSSVEA